MNQKHRLFLSTRPLAVACATILLSLLGTGSAFAHAQLIKSSPANKSELQEPPMRVELWFNELLDEGFNSIEVIPEAELSDKTHSNFAKGEPKVDKADPTHLTIELSALKPGKYVIQYRVLSRDGHTAPGRVSFQVLEVKP